MPNHYPLSCAAENQNKERKKNVLIFCIHINVREKTPAQIEKSREEIAFITKTVDSLTEPGSINWPITTSPEGRLDIKIIAFVIWVLIY